MSKTISAAVNPALANQILNNALNEEQPKAFIEPTIIAPSDNMVELPGGYINDAGEVIRTAEVREINGRDEEAISRATTPAKALLTILQRCTVKIGDEKVTEKLLDNLLSGDRDTLLLAILKVTFGSTPKVLSYCAGCEEVKEVLVDINTDIKFKMLTNPAEEAVFTVEGKAGDIVVKLPNGVAQKALINNSDKTAAELATVLLENTVISIAGSPVLSKLQVQNLSVVDRRNVIDAINEKNFGPQFEVMKTKCPDCEGEVSVPVTLDSLFRL